jgi:glycine dehydrogenase subunit 1
MEVSNASVYDGGSGLAEAILMAVRAHRDGVKRVLVPASIHPLYRDAVRAIVGQQAIEVVEIGFDASGRIDAAALEAAAQTPFAALVIGQPNFFGVLEEPDALTDWAQAKGARVIACCNPLSLAVLKPPGQWGTHGADIACGDAQPFGIPMSSGGPYLGFLTCKQALVRQMPGRIIGRTVDLDGKPGFTLTLQAREQHIRRAKATSNICTNQGLMVTAATIYLALTGPEGLENIARSCHARTREVADLLTALPGVEQVFDAPCFHEVVIRLPKPVAPVLAKLREQRINGGLDLSAHYPSLGQALLVCATETKTSDDLAHFARALAQALKD